MATKTRTVVEKSDVVQLKNPRSGHYIKIDRRAGRILASKSTAGPFKNVPMAAKKKK